MTNDKVASTRGVNDFLKRISTSVKKGDLRIPQLLCGHIQ